MRSRKVPSRGMSPSQHMDVFTNLEALCTLYFGDFYGGLIMYAGSTINSIFISLPFPEDWKWC